MAWLTFIADLSALVSELREANCSLSRIADALDRAVPPPLAAPDTEGRQTPKADDDSTFSFSESPEEYQSRTSHEANLAISLGVAPWSPAFQTALFEMRNQLMQPRVETDEEGNRVRREGYTEAEADDLVRQAFALAKAAANERPEAKPKAV